MIEPPPAPALPAPALPNWPSFGLSDDVRPELARALERGEACALVTLTRTAGGAPRPEGAQMLIGEGGALCGFLSGGCVEGDVALHAAQTLADGEPRTLVYGEGSPWPDIRLLCGARIELLVERVAPDDEAAHGASWPSPPNGAPPCGSPTAASAAASKAAAEPSAREASPAATSPPPAWWSSAETRRRWPSRASA